MINACEELVEWMQREPKYSRKIRPYCCLSLTSPRLSALRVIVCTLERGVFQTDRWNRSEPVICYGHVFEDDLQLGCSKEHEFVIHDIVFFLSQVCAKTICLYKFSIASVCDTLVGPPVTSAKMTSQHVCVHNQLTRVVRSLFHFVAV
jgi:hypothetical protein